MTKKIMNELNRKLEIKLIIPRFVQMEEYKSASGAKYINTMESLMNPNEMADIKEFPTS
ncbi:MAG: hypothetical protein LBF65_02805 [Holosporales bacterium]|jgi:hypothetical protein|nr:hypothetical protein [Holosporales bacterium]